MGWRFLGLLVAVSFPLSSAAQNHEWRFAFLARGNFTTTSRIYPNPEASSNDLQVLNTPFNSVISGGLEVRAKWRDDSFFFYLSTEYLSDAQSALKLDGSLNPPRRVPFEDGYRVIPVEAGMQVYVPVGSQSWKLSMGGGVGGYYSQRILKVAGVNASSVGNPLGFGIHVALHAEYAILSGVSVIATMKFRDPEIDVYNKFDSPTAIYGNDVLTFPSGDVHSRINVDGMTLGLGIVVEIR